MQRSHLAFILAMAHTCGLQSVSEAVANWERHLTQFYIYDEIPAIIQAVRAEFIDKGIDLPISEEVANTSIYEFNTKHNIGIDFEEEDRLMEEWLNNQDFEGEIPVEEF